MEVPADQVIDFVKQAPLSELVEATINALDQVVCCATQGRERIQRYQPLPIKDISADDIANSEDPIVKAFLTYHAS
jgi:hypothetical protein